MLRIANLKQQPETKEGEPSIFKITDYFDEIMRYNEIMFEL